MAEIHQLKSDDALGREACAWIANLDARAVSDEEKRRFDAWRKADPRHERAWALTVLVWRQMLDAGKLARAISNGQTFNEITQRAVHRSLQARKRARHIALASAAAIAASACVAWWMQTLPPKTEFQTAIGEHSTVKLPDGSTVDLNSNSRASITYSAQARIVRLVRGEAYFDVQSDPQRPFWVLAGKSWVGAVGTAFNVDMRRELLRVTVSEGAVKVASSASSITPPAEGGSEVKLSLVKAGQQVDVQAVMTEVRSLVPDQLTRSLSWRDGSIYFERESLATVVDELNRYTLDRIVIADETLRDHKIAGTFETNARGAEALLANLKDGLGFEVRREGNTAYIARR